MYVVVRWENHVFSDGNIELNKFIESHDNFMTTSCLHGASIC